MDTPVLLPCPWCGAPAAVEVYCPPTPYEPAPTEYFISCSHEGAGCPVNLVFVGPCTTLADAARRWNTRAPPV